jgi:HTH-type transcriptional regulator/antitoxin HigA
VNNYVQKNFEIDDFPLSPKGSQSATEFFESYLSCKELLTQLPKNFATEEESFKVLNAVQSSDANRLAMFRKKPTANEALIMVWMSKVRYSAKLCVAYNKVPAFNGITKDDLSKIAKLSADEANLSELAAILFEFGIILVYERALQGTKLDGAVFLLDSKYPVIGMSLRYPRLDIFWFTLMHELAHLAMHYDLLNKPIIDDLDSESDDLVERQANRLAANSFIERSEWRSCSARYSLRDEDIVSFSRQLNIHPAIVAGRIQKDTDRFNLFSLIVNSVNVRKVLLGHE